MIKELFDFMVWSPSRYVTTLASLVVIGIVVVCNGFSFKGSKGDQNVIKGWVGAPRSKSPPCLIWWPRHCGSGDMMLVVVEGQGSTCSTLGPPRTFNKKE